MADPNGFAALGDLLGGGVRQRSQLAFQDQLGKSAQAAKLFNEANIARSRAMAHAGLTPEAMVSLGFTPEQSAAVAAFAGTGESANLQQTMAALGEMDKQSLRDQQIAAATGGDVDLMNRLTAVAGNKPLTRTQIVSGQAFDPFAAPTQSVNVTPLGESMIAENQGQAAAAQSRVPLNQALGRAADARVGASNATAERSARAVTLKTLLPELEKQVGRKLTAAERAQLSAEYLATGTFDLPTKTPALLGGPSASDATATLPALGGGSTGTVTMPGGVSFDAIPAQARSQLVEGQPTQFRNGQVWTLVQGHPVRVK